MDKDKVIEILVEQAKVDMAEYFQGDDLAVLVFGFKQNITGQFNCLTDADKHAIDLMDEEQAREMAKIFISAWKANIQFGRKVM